MSNKAKVTVVMIPDGDEWVVYAPALGISSVGDSRDHALAMIKDAVEGMLEVGHQETFDLLDAAYSKDAALGTVEIDVPAIDKVRLTG